MLELLAVVHAGSMPPASAGVRCATHQICNSVALAYSSHQRSQGAAVGLGGHGRPVPGQPASAPAVRHAPRGPGGPVQWRPAASGGQDASHRRPAPGLGPAPCQQLWRRRSAGHQQCLAAQQPQLVPRGLHQGRRQGVHLSGGMGGLCVGVGQTQLWEAPRALSQAYDLIRTGAGSLLVGPRIVLERCMWLGPDLCRIKGRATCAQRPALFRPKVLITMRCLMCCRGLSSSRCGSSQAGQHPGHL